MIWTVLIRLLAKVGTPRCGVRSAQRADPTRATDPLPGINSRLPDVLQPVVNASRAATNRRKQILNMASV